MTLTAPARTTTGARRLLDAIAAADPSGDLSLIADNRSRHPSAPIPAWLAAPPRVQPVVIPRGACWLHRHEGWWTRAGGASSAETP